MRLAFFSPLNPQKSGICDYSEELLPFLAQQAEIDIVLADGVTPSNSSIAEHFTWYPADQFEQRHQQHPYDLCLYQMGNNLACHRYMDDFIQRYPGIVTLHDYMIHHFYAALFNNEKRHDEYERELRTYYGGIGQRLADSFHDGIRCDYVYYQFPFYQRVVNPSLGTIVHANYVKTKLLNYNPAYQVEMIPMGVMLPNLEQYTAETLRAKYHIPQKCFVIASFGFIIKGKRIRELLEAFSTFANDVPDALLMLVGKESPDFDVKELIRTLNLEEKIIVTGFTPYHEFLDYIDLADVCVNLRYPTVRSTSANILKIMGFAKPVVASDLCEYIDIPDDCCVKIPLHTTEHEKLVNAFHTLHQSPEQREELGRKARLFVEKHHTLQQAAEKYIVFCQKMLV